MLMLSGYKLTYGKGIVLKGSVVKLRQESGTELKIPGLD